MFGVNVGLAYSGFSFYSAPIGKFTTVLLYIYMIYFGLHTLNPVLTNETKSLISEVRIGGSGTKFNPGELADGFGLAFGFLKEFPDDKNYGSFKFELKTREGNNPKRSITASNEKCGDKLVENSAFLKAIPDSKHMRCSNVWNNKLFGKYHD